ncbi:trace amine-associated receptor 1-like [Discoglossus pictus]
MSEWLDFVNGSTSQVDEFCHAAILNITTRLFLYTLLSGLILTILIGNILVVISIAYFKQLHNPTNSFVLSLAVADLLVGVVVMPYSMIRTIERCWYFGPVFCRLHSSLDVMLCTASILHLSCIAFDRYYAVCNPLLYGYKMSQKRVTTLICICWIIPVVISFAPIMLGLHLLGVEHILPDNLCFFLVNQVYSLCASFVAFYLPMLIMLVAYYKIYREARKQALQIHARERNTSIPKPNDIPRKCSFNRERKAARTLGIIMGFFLVFWTPFFTANIIDPFVGYKMGMLEWEVFLWLGYANSMLNPSLYGLFHKTFRRAFLMVMGCKICIPGTSPNIDLSNAQKENMGPHANGRLPLGD